MKHTAAERCSPGSFPKESARHTAAGRCRWTAGRCPLPRSGCPRCRVPGVPGAGSRRERPRPGLRGGAERAAKRGLDRAGGIWSCPAVQRLQMLRGEKGLLQRPQNHPNQTLSSHSSPLINTSGAAEAYGAWFFPARGQRAFLLNCKMCSCGILKWSS